MTIAPAAEWSTRKGYAASVALLRRERLRKRPFPTRRLKNPSGFAQLVKKVLLDFFDKLKSVPNVDGLFVLFSYASAAVMMAIL